MEHEPMPTQWVLTNHRSRPLRQPVEPAAHVHGLTRQPDPRFLRTVHRLQTRQPDHDAVSTTASNARTCSASNPRPTSRLRPFCNRISTRESLAAFGVVLLSCTSRNFTAVSSRNRFFHAKKYGLHRLRSRQNAVTVCPLRACSEISRRHFVHAFFLRLVMSQPCTATRSFTRWGSVNAHVLPASLGAPLGVLLLLPILGLYGDVLLVLSCAREQRWAAMKETYQCSLRRAAPRRRPSCVESLGAPLLSTI